MRLVSEWWRKEMTILPPGNKTDVTQPCYRIDYGCIIHTCATVCSNRCVLSATTHSDNKNIITATSQS
jgi:hypothetical protein